MNSEKEQRKAKMADEGNLVEITEVPEIQKKIFEYIKENPHITSKKLATLIGVTSGTILLNISQLIERGMLVRLKNTKQSYWTIIEHNTKNDTKNDTTIITDNQQLILDYIIKKPSITISELSAITRIKASEVSSIIAQIKTKRIFERIGGKRNGYWKIKWDDTGKIKKIDIDQQVLLENIVKKPTISYKELSAITGFTAGKIMYNINRLKARGFIARMGSGNSGYWMLKKWYDAKTTTKTMQEYNKNKQKYCKRNLPDTPKKLLKYIKNNPYISSNELSNLMGITQGSVTLYFTYLKQRGIIQRIGKGKGSYWEVMRNDTQKNTRYLDNDQKLIHDHITKNPFITIHELIAVTGFSDRKVNFIISLLKDREILERVGNNPGYWKIKKIDTENSIETMIEQYKNQQDEKNRNDFMPKNQKMILEYAKMDSNITVEKLSALLEIQIESVKKNINILKNKGFLERVGSETDGYWIVKKEEKKKTTKRISATEKILLDNMIKNPCITRKELSDISGLEIDIVNSIILRLKMKNVLKRTSSKYSDYWEVNFA